MRCGWLFLLCAMFTSAQAAIKTSEEYAALSRRSWSAFECSALALIAGNTNEQRRLFTLGYESGKEFIEAVRAGKVEDHHARQHAPIGMLLKMEGPTADFMLGRIWEAAFKNATKEAYDSYAKYSNESLRTQIARSEFERQNCALL